MVRQVSEAIARAQSLEDQITIARRAVESSEKTLGLSRERQQFDIANVLENILAEQDLTRSRADYISVIAEFNKAQYELLKSIGALKPGAPERHSAK